VAVGKLYIAGELCGRVAVDKLCGRGRAVWPWVSCMAAGKLCGRGQTMWPWANYVAVGKLCGRG
jgi:hypothetical protein